MPIKRALRNLLCEPPVRLLAKAMLWNRLAFRYAFKWVALFDALDYPAYALGLQTACRYASLAGVRGFTAIEFGVAGGTGLKELSVYAHRISKESGLEIRVAGFDTGAGLPPSSDYRDAPWLWKPGDFPSDVDLLRRVIPPNTELVLGRIEETFPRWISGGTKLPVGFISVDVDYFSSSSALLKVLGAAETDALLPIVSFYFDDLLQYLTPRSTGEYAAISAFNREHDQRKLDRDDWLRERRPFGESLWLHRMYSLYCFDHPVMVGMAAREQKRLDLVF